ncbi:unnamed protein product [Rotaria sp. Silwood2]|nr:unnamed protein product [Rotaria sp. Silwood2]CAF2837691.1 unnamed protein product [Rotaria sp. Silwood2]CAF4537037.1 unnamed protein product [Rotaria sp. Silwood2]
MHLRKIRPPVLNHLTHVSLKLNYIRFDQFEQLGIDLFAKIQALRVSINYNSDVAYMDGNRWEKLILSHMPNLRIFDIRHESWPSNTTANNNSNNIELTLDSRINQFTSPFWIERQWSFALQHNQSRYGNPTIFYSTDPYRYQ